MSAFDEIREDVIESLRAWFEPVGDGVFADVADDEVPLEEGLAVVGADNRFAVGWRYHCTQTEVLHGIPPTGETVVIRGATILELDEAGDHRFHRYIDWLHVYAQLGVSAGGRQARQPAASAEPP